MKKILIGSLMVIALFGSCSKSTDTQVVCDANYDPCALRAPEGEINMVKTYIADHIDSIKQFGDTVRHCSGLYYAIKRDSAGTGKTADVCSYVNVRYTGMLTDSTIFANNITGTLYMSQLINGFKDGIPLIKEGGVITLFIPPTLAYGSQANGGIPANSILIFRVTLLSVQ